MRDGDSLWHWYRKLIALRKAEPALSRGSLEFVAEGERGVIAWLRRDEKTVACLMNLSGRHRTVRLDSAVPATSYNFV